MTANDTDRESDRSKTNIRLALAIAGIALTIYFGFIYLTGTAA